MNTEEPKFTLRLEAALRELAKDNSRTLALLSRRHEVTGMDLAEWLKKYNGGSKTLLLKRLLEVITLAKAPAAKAAPSARPAVALPTMADLSKWLDAQHAKIVGRIACFQVEVTPELARAWLTVNINNRRPSCAKIKRFAAAIKAGNWALNGETVKFSVSGRLLDGQSRLQAIVEAGVAAQLEVRAGLPDVAQQSMDCGEIRKGTHTLEMLGEANTQILSPALKWLWLWEKGWFVKKPFGVSVVMENSEVQPFIEKHPDMKKSVGWVVNHARKVSNLMRTSEAAFLYYLLRHDTETRDHFFEALVDGVGLTKASPVYHLRERLLADRTGGDCLDRVQRAALVLKAWNLVQRGEHATALRWAVQRRLP